MRSNFCTVLMRWIYILRAFLCRYFFRTIDSHECLRENIIMIQIFNDIVVRCYSSTERLRIACVSWKLRKVKLPGWLYEQFRRSGPLLSLTNSLKMYHASTLIAKRARNLKAILASPRLDQPTGRYYSRCVGSTSFIVKRQDIFHKIVFKVCDSSRNITDERSDWCSIPWYWKPRIKNFTLMYL